jgi:dihydropteroate synthase
MTINIKGELIDLSKPKIMGILNLTPDSFYDGGKYNKVESALKQTDSMIEAGANFIDVGAYSTKPGAKPVSVEVEKKRLLPILEKLIKTNPKTLFSIDTFRSTIAAEALDLGAALINDISGGQFDNKMMETVGNYNVPYVLMHTSGKPEIMQKNPRYKNVIKEVTYYFSNKIQSAYKAGINDIILDPGFGFGKTISHNYEILKNLEFFQNFELPLMIGLSRKSMIYKKLGISPGKSINGTTILNTVALIKGANIIRVHDVKQAKECVDLLQALR